MQTTLVFAHVLRDNPYTAELMYFRTLLGNEEEKLDNYRNELALLDRLLDSTRQNTKWVQERKYLIEAQIIIAENEMDAIKKEIHISENGMCKTCTGLGKLREHICEDETKLHTCDGCGGTGRIPVEDKSDD